MIEIFMSIWAGKKGGVSASLSLDNSAAYCKIWCMAVPKYDDLFNPLLRALHELGGSASVQEMEEKVSEILNLSDKDINEIHRGTTTKLNYRLTWTRNYLKRYGVLENSSRGVWSLTLAGNKLTTVNKNDVNKFVKKIETSLYALKTRKVINTSEEPSIEWQENMLNILKQMEPNDFERLCQRILREAGFIQVKITGRSGDGGIDGMGTIRVGGFLGFRTIFQCKRYVGSVSCQQIREFKGTMVGRADKGLFITTGNFTRDARIEAGRDGSTPIDLVDGYQLVEKMKELGLGVKVKTEEIVEVDPDWFKNF